MAGCVQLREHDVAVRRDCLARSAVHADRVTASGEVHAGGVGRNKQLAPRPARQGEVRGPPHAGEDRNAPRVVGALIRRAYGAVRGDAVERDFMIARG